MSTVRNALHRATSLLMVGGLLSVVGCGPAITDEAAAERAVVGLEDAIGKMLALGFAGFNSASSANIDAQSADGADTGTVTIDGQVDQGASANKEMRLDATLVDYSDGEIDDIVITYDTAEGAPVAVDLSLRDIPNGTVVGTFTGTVVMSGDLGGDVVLDLDLSGDLEAGDDDDVLLTDGQTVVTGTATSDFGVFNVDFAF